MKFLEMLSVVLLIHYPALMVNLVCLLGEISEMLLNLVIIKNIMTLSQKLLGVETPLVQQYLWIMYKQLKIKLIMLSKIN